MKKETKKINLLPIIAAVVLIAAVAVTLLPKGSKDTSSTEDSLFTGSGDLMIETAKIQTEASFFDYDAEGTTVQVFAVKASDGTIRLALNTCQVCNGSPYAYFLQEGDAFICQNCKNRFASTDVGIISGGCNPIPITNQIYTEQDGIITIPASFLKESAVLFRNWKNF